MIEILLTDDDLTLCHHAAIHREKVRARIRGHKPNNIHNSTTDLYQACFLGVQGEMAVARYLDLEDDWDPFEFGGIDLDGWIEVKTRRRGLPMHIALRDTPEGDRPRPLDTAYVLVYGDSPWMTIRGWCTLKDALQIGEWTPPFPNYPTLKIPREYLDTPDGLIQVLNARRARRG